MRRALTTLMLATLITCGFTSAQPFPSPANASPAMAAASGNGVLAAAAGCKDVLVVGARGSGEKADEHAGVGRTVALAAARLRMTLANHGRSMRLVPLVDYPARSVGSIVFGQVWDGKGIQRYMAGVDVGVREGKQKIAARANNCPDERIVLIGYSQGAMVVHRIWNDLSRRAQQRVSAVVLIADPDRISHTRGELVGSPNAPAASQGVASVVFDKDQPDVRDDRFPGTQVWQVCTVNDIVCDTRPRTLNDVLAGKEVHTRYDSNPDQRRMLSAVARQAGLATAVCPLRCTVRDTYPFEHPTWERSRLLLVGGKHTWEDMGTTYTDSHFVVVDDEDQIQWLNPHDAMYTLKFARPAMDASGNIFTNYNPGRYNGVVILKPIRRGFKDYDTLDNDGYYGSRFYNAQLEGPGPDGLYTIHKRINDCDPTCAEGTISDYWYVWNGSKYVLRN